MKKLHRRAYGRTINLQSCHWPPGPNKLSFCQTQSNGSLIDPLIAHAALMRLTPVYWLLFACFPALFSPLLFTLLRLAAHLQQIRTLKRWRGRAGMWAPWTASPRWRKKNSLRISGLTWVCMSAHLCVCVCVGTKGRCRDKWVYRGCCGCLPALTGRWDKLCV